MKDLFSLQGKVAVVTGGNRGIGEGIARGFAESGGEIIIVARSHEKTVKVVQEIKDEFKVQALGIKVDLMQEDQIQSMVEQALDEFGRVDILVNNAGMNIHKMPQDYSTDEWDEILDVNLRGTFLCSKAVYPSMKKAGGGKIINIGSMASIFGAAKLVPYGASKAGVVQLTRSLAVAWAPDNVQVNAILPGCINTELTVQARKAMPGFHEQVIARTPDGRWGEPDDLKGTAIFLASRASDFITGIALPVDGGFSSVMV
jgi:2-deoxy-D-gluconate 3-dehydrogenase